MLGLVASGMHAREAWRLQSGECRGLAIPLVQGYRGRNTGSAAAFGLVAATGREDETAQEMAMALWSEAGSASAVESDMD